MMKFLDEQEEELFLMIILTMKLVTMTRMKMMKINRKMKIISWNMKTAKKILRKLNYDLSIPRQSD